MTATDLPYDDHYTLLSSLWGAVMLHLFFTVLLKTLSVITDGIGSLRHFYHATEAQPILAHEGTRQQTGSWAQRLERSTLTTTRNFMILLASAIFLSIPIAYRCKLEDDSGELTTTFSAMVGSMAGRCVTCLTNAVTGNTVAMAWTYVGVSVLWGLLDIFSVGEFMHAVLGSVLAVVG
ncbi:hypothetical protein HDU67_004321 [Dinochytrium kinnereticum]|nr:hypothetical protein HDU67_004321 [Dinochytrium kinnereticum]